MGGGVRLGRAMGSDGFGGLGEGCFCRYDRQLIASLRLQGRDAGAPRRDHDRRGRRCGKAQGAIRHELNCYEAQNLSNTYARESREACASKSHFEVLKRAEHTRP